MHVDKLSREALAPYLPIPHGGRRVLIGVFLAIAAIGMVSSWWTLPFVREFWFPVPLVGALVLAWQIVASFRDPEFGGNPTKWFTAFLVRNVKGYELWCIRNLYGDATVTYEIHRCGDFVQVEEKKMVIVVPLRTGTPCEVRVPDWSLSYWSLRTAGIALDFHAGMIVVRMQDVNGDRITVDVEHAFRILLNDRSTLQNDKLTNNFGSAGLLVEGLMIRLDETNATLATEHTDRDQAVAELDEARERIDATKRFSRSVDAMHIRDWLAQRVIAHVAFRDFPRPRRDTAA